jgi:hypothetical protein
MNYVITCGDEGVQINVGRRISIVGAGLELPDLSKVLKLLKKLLGNDLRIVGSGENDWVKEKYDLNTYEQADATMQQKLAALADKEGLLYSGFLPFADPRQLEHDIKGHMVRPKGVHIANKICFTLAGGEQTYNLGQYQISAEWIHLADKKLAETFIKTQVDFYTKLAGGEPLAIVFEEKGDLGEKIAQKNRAALENMGFQVK